MKKRKFEISMWKESNRFVIVCEKPHVASHGKTLKEAFEMIGDAIELFEDKSARKE